MRGTFGLTQLQLLRTPLDESFEPLGVDLDVLRDSVGSRAGWFRSGRRDKPPQPHDAPWDDMGPEAGGSSPQSAAARDSADKGCTQADRERTHHRTIPRSQWNPAVVESQRSKNANLHSATVTPTPTSVKTADIGPIHDPLGAVILADTRQSSWRVSA